jgi:hypothetical protein
MIFTIMIKQSLILSLFLALAINATCQKVSLSVLANGGFANISPDYDPGLSGSAGFAARYSWSDKFSVNLGLQYGLRRARYFSLGGNGPLDEYEMHGVLNFQNLYLLPDFSWHPWKRLSIAAGPYLGLRLSVRNRVRESWVEGGSPRSREYVQRQSGFHEQFDFGVNARVEYVIVEKLSATLQFQQGFRNLWAIDLVPIRRVNQYLGLGLAYRFLGR